MSYRGHREKNSDETIQSVATARTVIDDFHKNVTRPRHRPTMAAGHNEPYHCRQSGRDARHTAALDPAVGDDAVDQRAFVVKLELGAGGFTVLAGTQRAEVRTRLGHDVREQLHGN